MSLIYYRPLKHVANRFDLPIIITENGVDADDEQFRIGFIRDHLSQIHRAMNEGVPVKGYMHWSLTDHCEWTWGIKPRFGLIRVDYAKQKRTIKDGGRWYADLVRRNTPESALAFPKGGAS